METDISRLTPGVDGRLKGEQTSLDAAAERYLASKTKAEGGGNYSHAASYALTEFVGQMLKQNVATVGHLDKHSLTDYATYLKTQVGRDDRDLSAESARTYYNIVAGFLGWCVGRDLIDTNYARKQVAEDELPNDEGSGKQQYWSETTRERLLLYLDWKTEDVIENGWMDEDKAVRDRAYVSMLALTGVRNAELLRSPHDDRRDGLRWSDVDFDASLIYVLGKSQNREEVPLLDRAARWLRAHERRLDPPTDDWPVFPTGHAPSRYSAARAGLRAQGNAEDEVETILEANVVDDVLHDHEIAPPAMTTEGGRQLIRELSIETNILEDGDYLEPHGARRGVGQSYYMEAGHEAAQKVLRHQDPAVTSKQYSHVETGELREIGEGVIGDDRRSEPQRHEGTRDLDEDDDIPDMYR